MKQVQIPRLRSRRVGRWSQRKSPRRCREGQETWHGGYDQTHDIELIRSVLGLRVRCLELQLYFFWGLADQVELMLQLADDKKVLKQLEDDPHVKTLDD